MAPAKSLAAAIATNYLDPYRHHTLCNGEHFPARSPSVLKGACIILNVANCRRSVNAAGPLGKSAKLRYLFLFLSQVQMDYYNSLGFSSITTTSYENRRFMRLHEGRFAFWEALIP